MTEFLSSIERLEKISQHIYGLSYSGPQETQLMVKRSGEVKHCCAHLSVDENIYIYSGQFIWGISIHLQTQCPPLSFLQHFHTGSCPRPLWSSGVYVWGMFSITYPLLEYFWSFIFLVSHSIWTHYCNVIWLQEKTSTLDLNELFLPFATITEGGIFCNQDWINQDTSFDDKISEMFFKIIL